MVRSLEPRPWQVFSGVQLHSVGAPPAYYETIKTQTLRETKLSIPKIAILSQKF
ncbi:MAG TPA: hypothetical protein PK110_06290 [Niabella sp.]|nr:hypothetical protein [Chitinophagaceae bacterium]HRO84414.1 hypothetical protein [Niabella sp.]